MKVFTNTAMLFGAIIVMGWLMLAQSAYQRSFSRGFTAQASSTNQANLATSMDRAMLALR